MPTYEYECPEHGVFEEEHSIKIKLEFCPQCKEAGKDQEIKRLISLGGKGVVTLTGYELKAKIKEDAKKISRDANLKEKTLANMIGETRFNEIQTAEDKKPRRRR